MKKIFLPFLFLSIAFMSQAQETILRLAVAGTSHGHVSWILGRKDKKDIELVGVYDKDTQLLNKQSRNFKLASSIIYTDLNKMLDEVKPEAVVAFGSIYDHLAVVEACAPRGIHVMVEKPLAVSVEHANKMKALADKYKIKLLTNYETSWYPATKRTYELAVEKGYTGPIRKAVFHHGHEGPKEIGVGAEFFNWLTDPIQNGGGALIDFGCYGANIMSWLMKGERPIAVTAVTKQYKPSIYPKVDDEATIIVDYPSAQAIIQASWNWPYSRKDMEVYGVTGWVVTQNDRIIRRNNKEQKQIQTDSLTVEATGVYTDPFAYFKDAIRGKIIVEEYSLYSLSNNLRVVEILDAARKSAKTGKTVRIGKSH